MFCVEVMTLERRSTLPKSESQTRVQSVERVFRLLEKLVMHTEMSLGQLAEEVGMHKSTAYRLLQTLIQLGYVEQNETQGSYRIGLRMIEMGGMAIRSWPLHRAAEPIMDHLASELGEAVNLAIEDGLEMVYVVTVDAYQPLRMQLNVGRRAPIHCTAVGKAALAHNPDLMRRLRDQKPVLQRFTDHTITNWDRLQVELDLILARGYAIDNEEQAEGARCVASPIVNHRNHVTAVLGISAPSAHLSRERADEVGPRIVDAARQISERLGYLGKA